MVAGKGPKVEVRSRTGAPYSRAGHRWHSEWADVPVELLRDDGKMETIVRDPHLELRVDGEYKSGPRAGQKSRPNGDGGPAAYAGPSDESVEEIRRLREQNRELENRLEKQQIEHEQAMAMTSANQGPVHGAAQPHFSSAPPALPNAPQGKSDEPAKPTKK